MMAYWFFFNFYHNSYAYFLCISCTTVPLRYSIGSKLVENCNL